MEGEHARAQSSTHAQSSNALPSAPDPSSHSSEVKEKSGRLKGLIGLAPAIKAAFEDKAGAAELAAQLALAIPSVRYLLDSKADAFAIGHSLDASIGFGVETGGEIVYIRATDTKPARLRVNELSGRSAILGVSGGKCAFVRCFYGDRDTIAMSNTRKELRVGALFAGVGFFSVTADDIANYSRVLFKIHHGTARGWTNSLGTWRIGPPIISNFSANTTTSQPSMSIDLTKEQEALIEKALDGAPDRSVLRKLALSKPAA
jgi:hypothetical protein